MSQLTAPDKTLFQLKSNDIFLIFLRNHMLLVLIRSARQGVSNEYPQHNMFVWRH